MTLISYSPFKVYFKFIFYYVIYYGVPTIVLKIFINNYLYNYIICIGKLTGIRREAVNYVGYYSIHEEKMKEVIHSQVKCAHNYHNYITWLLFF